MRTEDLIPCPFCGSKSYRPGGGSYGILTQQNFTCWVCDALVVTTQAREGALLSFIPRDACTLVKHLEGQKDEWVEYEYPKEWVNWIDKVVIPTWRFRTRLIYNHKDKEWRQWLKEVFYMKFPWLYGKKHVDPVDEEETDLIVFDDEHISYSYMPVDAQKLYDETFYQGNHNKCVYQVGAYLEMPPDLLTEVYPPQMPETRVANFYQKNDGTWERVEAAKSRELEVPEDPILTDNREFFEDVWKNLSGNLGLEIPERSECKNEYGGKEPWYFFTLNGVRVRVGWRKRVVSIDLEASRLLSTELMRNLAVRDKVTYEAYGPIVRKTIEEVIQEIVSGSKEPSDEMISHLRANLVERNPSGYVEEREGGWQSPMEKAERILIHAWGKNQTIEYLEAACRIALKV
jgi:hypothetical protein